MQPNSELILSMMAAYCPTRGDKSEHDPTAQAILKMTKQMAKMSSDIETIKAQPSSTSGRSCDWFEESEQSTATSQNSSHEQGPQPLSYAAKAAKATTQADNNKPAGTGNKAKGKPQSPPKQDRTLVVQLLNKIAEGQPLRSEIEQYKLTQAVNTALAKANTVKLQVSQIKVTLAGNLSITGIKGTTASALREKRDLWQNLPIFLGNISTMDESQAWHKAVIHNVSRPIYDNLELDKGTSRLRDDLANLLGMELAAEPRWINPPEKRANKVGSSIVVAFRTKAELDRYTGTKVKLHGRTMQIGRWHHYTDSSQCGNCQGFGHGSATCRKPPKCGACGGEHKTCKSSIAHCSNCGGEHKAASSECPERQAAHVRHRERMTRKAHLTASQSLNNTSDDNSDVSPEK